MLEGEQWLSRREVCKRFGVSDDTIVYWIKNKNFPACKDGTAWRFKWSEIEAWCKTEDAANTRAVKINYDTAPPPATDQKAEKKSVSIQTVISYKPLFKMLVDLELKKKDLAELADISIATITKMGRMGSHVNTDVLERICLALKCKIGDILEIVQVSDEDLLVDVMEEDEVIPLDPVACEEYGLTQTEQEIVRFVYEQLQYYRDNPPAFMINQVREENGNISFEQAKQNIPTDRFYSLVFNDVIEKWGQEGCTLGKKGVPFSLIESGYFQAEDESLGEMIVV